MEPQQQWMGTTFGSTVWNLYGSAPPGNFVFRNRLDLKNNGRINIPNAEYVLSPEGNDELVILTAMKPDARIKDCSNLILWGGLYSDFEAALSGARKWRQISAAVFPRLGLGCDFGDDDEVHPREVKELHFRGLFNFTAKDNVYWDRVGLFILPAQDSSAAFLQIQAEEVGLAVLKELPKLIAAAENRHTKAWSDDLRLAYSLVHAGLGATENLEARYIFAVTAIEALIPYRRKHPELCKVLDALILKIDELVEFDAESRDSVRMILENNKRDSVNKYGRELAGRLTDKYDGKDPKIFWRDSYKVRSGLAHGNPRSQQTKEALTREFLELLRFVLDILDSWAENSAFESNEPNSGQTAHEQ